MRSQFLRHLAQTSPAPLMLEIERAEGIYIYTPDNKKYIDFISGISVSNLGHSNPEIIAAVKGQLDKFMHIMVYGEVIQSPQVLLAESLKQTLPSSLDNVYLVNSGSEAVEGAMKLSKRFTGRSEIISFYNSYHGSSQGALSLNGNTFLQNGYHPLLPGIKHLEYNSIQELKIISENTAAVFIELVQGEAGVRNADHEFVKKLSEQCKRTGTLLVVDEIQTGYGRTGKFWAIEHYNLVPDILLCAKGMGGGMPIGAFISRKEIMQVLTGNPALGHITTFGGHPVSCAASRKALELIYKKEFLEDVLNKGEYLKSQLQSLPHVEEVRGIGLMLAADLNDAGKVEKVISNAMQKGLLIDWFLYSPESLRIAPPLTISKDEIDEAVSILKECLDF